MLSRLPGVLDQENSLITRTCLLGMTKEGDSRSLALSSVRKAVAFLGGNQHPGRVMVAPVASGKCYQSTAILALGTVQASAGRTAPWSSTIANREVRIRLHAIIWRCDTGDLAGDISTKPLRTTPTPTPCHQDTD